MANIPRSVCFFLVETVVAGDTKQHLTRGSKATVQCFVPGVVLEASLVALDKFLATQELRRIDLSRAIRYDPDDEDEDYPGKYFRKPLEEASAGNRCVLGVFIVDEETSRWRDKPEERV